MDFKSRMSVAPVNPDGTISAKSHMLISQNSDEELMNINDESIINENRPSEEIMKAKGQTITQNKLDVMNSKSQTSINHGKPEVMVSKSPTSSIRQNKPEESQEIPVECYPTEISKHSKPKVFIKMEHNLDEKYFGIDKNALIMNPLRDRRVPSMPHPKPGHFTYKCDDILFQPSQEETFVKVALELTDKAMYGDSGILLVIGTLHSGKSYSLFGDTINPGIIHRTIDRIFQISERNCYDIKFDFSISFVNINNNVVRDCVYLGKEIEHGKNAKRKLFKSALAGYRIIEKALKNIPDKNNNSTIVYIHINGREAEHKMSFHSKITFAEIASTIPRLSITADDSQRMKTELELLMNEILKLGFDKKCIERRRYHDYSVRKTNSSIANSSSQEKISPEEIQVRRDIFLMEEMFLYCAKMSKEKRYFEELKMLGLKGKLQRPKFLPEKFFRHSKLADCLSETVSGHCDIRILAHLIPQGKYMFDDLKVLRFAVRASLLVPLKLNDKLS